ncbi:coiled-coil domain-containing protein 34 [Drosophila biarmipes]|uniref:coiled-coil domain-containing protein 34 n=1 Tax=Drosophila biarmipes TaxID=125945 RepID=UPI0007E80615|nr:coiled-coil domain-containing protein 34 [Drosophila biarmipes]XP_016963268.1 coiled-coil domain-containing protein 34 [Drosophila biarmipes]
MAFLGRVNNQGTFIDCEAFCGHQQDSAGSFREDEASALLPRPKGSRTYIKTYDKESLLRSMGSPSTVRYVGSSVSSSEVTSLDETETSTLRCGSDVSLGHHDGQLGEGEDLALQTESETLCLELDSPSSSQSSGSSRTPSSTSCSPSSSDKGSTTSMCSWEEAMSRDESMLPPQELPQGLSLPSLHLGSNGVARSPPLTYTRRLDPIRVQRSAGEAYENWLSGKRRQCQYRLQAEQAEREEQRERIALRQRLAKEKYEQWCQQKAQKVNSSSPKNTQVPVHIPARKNPASVQHHLQEWELQKMRLIEQRRQELRSAERRREHEKTIRRQQAEQAFSRWMSNVAQRPKPVPSSQGMKSLRGTVSDIFINPNQWVD